MAFSLKKIFGRITDVLFYTKPPTPLHIGPRKLNLSPEKQRKLEALYRQLLSNQELVTSGKIQFIGLEQIKKRMGSKWSGLSSFVYEITEEIIKRHTDSNDLFLGYRDDSYAIIFAKSSTEEAAKKVNAIVEEIRQRLFTLDEEQLKKLEIKKTVQQVKTKSFLDDIFPELTQPDDAPGSYFTAKGKKASALYSDKIDVSAEDYKSKSSKLQETPFNIEEINFVYIPLWEVKRAALTTYICLPHHFKTEKKSFFAYNDLYADKTPIQQLQLDLAVLQHSLDEISQMEKDGRKLYIACPVRYETVYDFESYEEYKKACSKITDSQKQYLTFIVINSNPNLPVKDPYWFVNPLKAFGYDAFVEVPIKHDTNFQLLKASGVDTVGLHLGHSQMSEQEKMAISNSFSSKAKYFKIQRTFALDVSTLSATTSLVCAGFDYIGGSAIHEDVARPDTIHRYRYEDLLSEMTKSVS